MKDIKTLKPHVSINVKNVEASINFYRKLFAVEPSKVRTSYAKFDVQSVAEFRIKRSRLQ